VIGNVEFDHADIYPDLDAVRLAFRRLVNLVPRNGLLLLGADSKVAASLIDHAKSPVETFGTGDGFDWQAADVRVTGTGTSFKVRKNGTLLDTFEVPLLGLHNVRNALAAIAVGAAVGLRTKTMVDSLKKFQGVKRRLELRGSVDGIRVYDDFAHHPTAVAETLAALRLAHPSNRIWAIFEPRSASSCLRVFQQDFVDALRGADEVVLAHVFRERVPEEQRLSPAEIVTDLQEAGTSAHYLPTTQDIVQHVASEAKSGDLIVVMSNGGFDGIHDKLIAALKERQA
jgi:UDP-N-acetylmuramate: L-alanyl-gamma-D-glutamyl-meso-diaminopimelate ligase